MRVLFASIEWPFSDQPFRGPFAQSLAEALKGYMEVVPLPLPVRRNPLNILKYRKRVRETFDQYQCDHIHCYSLNTLFMVNPKHFPVSASAIGSDVLGKPNRNGTYTIMGNMPYLMLKDRIRQLRGIRCVSDVVKMKLEIDHGNDVPMTVLPNGIDLNRFSSKSREKACETLSWDPEPIHVFFPGHPERGVKNFQLANQLLHGAQKQLSIEVHTFPAVEPEQMNDYYRAADVVLITSHHEGSSNALKEALLCQTPVLTTPVGDAPYWLSHNVEGSLIDFEISQDEFTQLLQHYSKVKRSRNQGINSSIAAELDLNQVAGRFASFLESLN